MRPLKSVEEAAELLGISKWTVRKYIREGNLKAVRLGRRVLISEEELEQFVARSQIEIETKASTSTDNTKETAL